MVTRTLERPCSVCTEQYEVKLKDTERTRINHRPQADILLCRECVQDFLRTEVTFNSLDDILALGRSFRHEDSLIVPAVAGRKSTDPRCHRIFQARMINGVRKELCLFASSGLEPQLLLASSIRGNRLLRAGTSSGEFAKVTALVFKDVFKQDKRPAETTLHLGIFSGRQHMRVDDSDPLIGVHISVQEKMRDTKTWILEGTADFCSNNALRFQPFSIGIHARARMGSRHDSQTPSNLLLPLTLIEGYDLDVPGSSLSEELAICRGQVEDPQYGCLDGMQWVRTDESGHELREGADISALSGSPPQLLPPQNDWFPTDNWTPPVFASLSSYVMADAPGYSGSRESDYFAQQGQRATTPYGTNTGIPQLPGDAFLIPGAEQQCDQMLQYHGAIRCTPHMKPQYDQADVPPSLWYSDVEPIEDSASSRLDDAWTGLNQDIELEEYWTALAWRGGKYQFW